MRLRARGLRGGGGHGAAALRGRAAAGSPAGPCAAHHLRRLRRLTSTALRRAELSDGARAAAQPASHPNGALRIDHIVVFTADLGRTSAALEGAGLSLRRIREPDEPGPPVRQAFFRLGEVILEVVESAQADAGAARFWGLTLCVADIEACAELLGERLGEIRDAVQPGRRIATVRREAGLGLPVALISEEAR